MDVYVEKAVKRYGNKPVLNAQGLTIKEGDICGIIGPNGAGKTTLLHIIGGVLKSDEGAVFYGANKSAALPYKSMTLVFQKPYMLMTTVEKNITYPLKIRGVGEQEASLRAKELMDELGLTELRKQKANKLSGGETQKTAIARALSFRPKLLLLDEPAANLDPGSLKAVEALLTKTNREDNTTIIIITHNLHQTRRLCNTAVYMDGGKIVEAGPTENLLDNPQSLSLKEFLTL